MKPATLATVPPSGLRPGVRRFLSLLLALHVVAVFVGPWSMPPQRSQLSAAVLSWFRPYVELACLNNGYRFFAPQPGPAHLVRYEITKHDGSRIDGCFPDRQTARPRLLYHRYFMLSEFVNSLTNGAPREVVEAYSRSYARHLAAVYDAREVKLFLRRHYIPRVEEVQRGLSLSDPQLYEEKPLATYEDDAS